MGNDPSTDEQIDRWKQQTDDEPNSDSEVQAYSLADILVFHRSLSSSSVRTLRCGYTSAPWKRLFESA